MNEASDNMIGDLGMLSGANVNFYADVGITQTASLDGATGVLSLTMTDNTIRIGDGELVITDSIDGNIALGDGNVTLTDGNIAVINGGVTVGNGDVVLTGGGDVTLNNDGQIILTDTDGNITLADGDIAVDGDVIINPGAISDNTIVSTDILDNTITSDDVADNILTDNDLAAGSVGSLELADNGIVEADLQAVDAALPGECLTFDSASGGFAWESCGAVTGDFVKRMGDNMYGDLAFYDDNPIVNPLADETASISAMTGDAQFDGDATVGGDITTSLGRKFYFDIGLGNYLYEHSPNQIRLVVGGLPRLLVTTTGVAVDNAYLSVNSGRPIYVDGGNDTYIVELTNDVMTFAAGNDQGVMTIAPTGITVTSGNNLTLADGDIATTLGKKFYFDNGLGNYIYEHSANQIRLVVGGVPRLFATTNGVAVTDAYLSVDKGRPIYVDGGNDTYIVELIDNIMTFAAGNDPGVMQVAPSGVEITTGNNLNMVNGDITMAPGRLVDGVDVSELEGRVGLLEQGDVVGEAFAVGR